MAEELKKPSGELMAQLRGAFHERDWSGALALFQRLLAANPNRGQRVEATCLAVRALASSGQRRRARELIKDLDSKVYRKPVHYEFLAHAYLDLKQYENAAKACERAEALRVAEEGGA